MATFDNVLQSINPLGRYQVLMLVLYSSHMWISVGNIAFMAYGGLKPTWNCSIAKNGSSCDIYNNCPKSNLSIFADFYSIRMEWDLVCGKSYLARIVSSVQMFGLLVGSLVYAQFADRHGRKWNTVVVRIAQIVLGTASAFAWSWSSFAVLRFFVGLCAGCQIVISFIFMSEIVTNKERLLIRALAASPIWYTGIQTLWAYLTQNWRSFLLLINLSNIPFIIPMVLFTFESPRWLLQKGRIVEAKKILRKISKINGKSYELPEEFEIEATKTSKNSYGVKNLFTSGGKLLSHTFLSILHWFAIGMIYYGLWFNLGSLKSNKSIYWSNLLLSFLSFGGIPIGILDYKFPEMFNRRRLLLSVMGVCALANLCVAAFEITNLRNTHSLVLVLISILGQVAAGIGKDLGYVMGTELFPTLLRATGTYISSASARLGSTLAPQILFLANFWEPIPYLIFGVVALGSVICAYFIFPATNSMDMVEIENLICKKEVETSL